MSNPLNKLRKIQTNIKDQEYRFQELLMKQFKLFKGKYIKDKIDSPVVKFSITFIPREDNNWSNCLTIYHSFFCDDGKSCWYILDEKRDMNELYELQKLIESQVITAEEYKNIKAEIVHAIQRDKVTKFNDEMKVMEAKL